MGRSVAKCRQAFRNTVLGRLWIELFFPKDGESRLERFTTEQLLAENFSTRSRMEFRDRSKCLPELEPLACFPPKLRTRHHSKDHMDINSREDRFLGFCHSTSLRNTNRLPRNEPEIAKY